MQQVRSILNQTINQSIRLLGCFCNQQITSSNPQLDRLTQPTDELGQTIEPVTVGGTGLSK